MSDRTKEEIMAEISALHAELVAGGHVHVCTEEDAARTREQLKEKWAKERADLHEHYVDKGLSIRNLIFASTDNYEEAINAKAMISELFTYRPWDEEQEMQGAKVNKHLQEAYLAIVMHVPPSPSRTRALNMITDARMLANQAITFKGEV